jgi:hypothetical protein
MLQKRCRGLSFKQTKRYKGSIDILCTWFELYWTFASLSDHFRDNGPIAEVEPYVTKTIQPKAPETCTVTPSRLRKDLI